MPPATVRLDAALDVGQVTETVEVQGNVTVEVNVSNAEVTQVLGEKYYRDLPVVMGADIRLAESLLAAQPGYVPMRPNGCPIFRGSQFQSRMNGGQTMAMENYLDGASFGSAIDHNNTQERSVPFDSVQETKIVTRQFLRAIRAHQRRLRRIYDQVGHLCLPRKRSTTTTTIRA